jgi:hypothetical protein
MPGAWIYHADGLARVAVELIPHPHRGGDIRVNSIKTFERERSTDLFDAIGNRRSIRYFLPYRPVER